MNGIIDTPCIIRRDIWNVLQGSKNIHDDVIKWKHFLRYRPFVGGIRRSPVVLPHKGKWSGALISSLICAWTNNRDAGDLIRHHAQLDVMWCSTQGARSYLSSILFAWEILQPVYAELTSIQLIGHKIVSGQIVRSLWDLGAGRETICKLNPGIGSKFIFQSP